MRVRRVVVTGIETLNPCGLSIEETMYSLRRGKKGISKITRFPTERFRTSRAGQVFLPDGMLDHLPKDIKKESDRFIHLGMLAAERAFVDSGLIITDANRDRIGVDASTGIGGITTIQHGAVQIMGEGKGFGPDAIRPRFIPGLIANALAAQISILLKLRGPSDCHTTACAASLHSLQGAYDAIMMGRAVAMIVGGAETIICELGVGGFDAPRALSPVGHSTPFALGRNGFVIGEGATFLVLEELEHALARGAHIYCEYSGSASTSDAHHMTNPAPGGDGLYRAMGLALDYAGLSSDVVGLVMAHGTSTPAGDIAETDALVELFGHRGVAVSAIKGGMGHLLGASGATAAAVAAAILNGSKIPQNRYLDRLQVDPRCDGLWLKNLPTRLDKSSVMINAAAFGGQNVSCVFSKYQ